LFLTVLLLAVIGATSATTLLSTSLVHAATEKGGRPALLDINTATAEQLNDLPSIGEVYTKKIIKGRPYQRKDELVQKKILPRTTYEQIKDKIIAKQEVTVSTLELEK
jgi:competence protein ComEA